MREMKVSGAEWVGEIPSDWSMQRGKTLFRQRNERGNDIELQLLSPTQKYGVIPQKLYEELSGMGAVKLGEKVDLAALKTIHKGDFCISLRSFQGGFEYSKYEGVVSPAYQVFYPTAEIADGYYKYLFKDASFIEKMNSYTMTLRDGKNIAFADFGNTYIPVPPLDEQRRIADFLDAKCAAADAYIARSQAVVERLLAYKKSVITEAVTQGLAPDAPRRASGIDWIGDIPAHWEVTRVKNIFSSGKGLPITKADLVNSGLPVISYGQIHSPKNTGVDISEELLRYVKLSYREEYPQCEVFQYDFVFADTSEDHEGCGNCVYKRDASPLFAGYHAIILHAKEKRDNRFLAYLFKTDAWRKQLREAVYGVKVLSVTKRMLMNCSVIIPPIEEQRAIADFLDAKCAAVDAVIARKREIISKISEYKRSLIYEAVTGKREV